MGYTIHSGRGHQNMNGTNKIMYFISQPMTGSATEGIILLQISAWNMGIYMLQNHDSDK